MNNTTWNKWEKHVLTAKRTAQSDIDNLRVALIGSMTPEQYAEVKRASKGPPAPKANTRQT